ncbi:hypothetical protein [Micromonospora inositola]|uniref:Epoxide hydrolase n=1 Tax=Micromonospora inositola TaxID=47865 RepID=A0A1C5JU01_9ACTN|nr:hypothetical protein [Micromonospora inositola]SCG73506.1 hypothetical protein GA0070613_5321 [Micromonospora inositola]
MATATAVRVRPFRVEIPEEDLVELRRRQLIYFNEVDMGGHFAAWEQPELFASEVRAAFRPLR